MKRLINVRIPLFCVIGLILGIVACHELLCGDLYFGIIVGALLVVGCILAIIFKRALKVILVLLVFAILGFGVGQFSYQRMQGNEVIERQVTLQGRVCDLGRNGNSGSVYYLENCVDLNTNEAFRGRVKVVYYTGSQGDFEVGEVLTLSGTMYSTYPVKKTVESYYVRNRIYYELVNPSLQEREAGKLKFDETARKYIYDLTEQYAPEYGGVIYALLTGDRNAVDDEVKTAFTRAGTIHLLAVSGLHVGFVVSILCFALKRFRLHPLIEMAIVAVPLVFYAYVCGFSPSVVRAILMTVCTYVARALLGKYDMLTSLSISAIIILFSTPYALFDVGFQLSFLSVFGIATLYATIMRAVNKRKINKFVKYILSSFLLSLCCVLATLFALATNFKQVPTLGALVNLIAIPLVSLTFALSMFALLPWVFHYLLVVSDKLLSALVWCNSKVATLSFATVSLSALAVSSVIAVVLMFILGGFVNVKKLAKKISCIACALLLAVTVIVALVPKAACNQAFVSFGYSETAIAATSDDGEAAIVSDFSDYSAVSDAVNFLQEWRIKSCTLYITEYASAREVVVELTNTLPVDKVYVLNKEGNDAVEKLFNDRGIVSVYVERNTSMGESIVVHTFYDGGQSAVNVSVGEIDVCLVTGNIEGTVLQYWSQADLYVVSGSCADFSQAQLATVSRYQSNLAYNYGANKYGNFTIRQKDDRIIFNFI